MGCDKKTSQCELKPKNRLTTLQALEQTLNKIFLLNNGAKITADYTNKEDTVGMVAERPMETHESLKEVKNAAVFEKEEWF